MSWSIKLGTFLGIEIKLHLTFLLLLVWVAMASYLPTRELADAVASLIFVGLVFGSVVLHELGHALVARRFGIPTRDITLLPIGGVARIERMPTDPRQELAIAFAGPLVSALLALAAFGVAIVVGKLDAPVHPEMPGDSLLVQLAVVNTWIALFNLLPAFPMDGGRILRALLTLRLGSARATTVAARIGQALALTLALVGLWTSPMLTFIALFVWMGATAENRAGQLEAALDGVTVESAMIPDALVLDPNKPLSVAVDVALHGFQHDFAVVEDGRLVGMLGRADLLAGLTEQGMHHRVGDAMMTDVVAVHPNDALPLAYHELARSGGEAIPVVDGAGRVRGLLTGDSIAERFLVERAIRRHATRRAA